MLVDISANVNIRNKIKFYLNWSFYFIFVLVAYVNQKRTRRYVELNKCHHITYTLFQRNHWNHLSFKTCICLIMPSSSISLLSYYHHKDNKRMVCLWCSNSVPYKRKSVSFTVRGFLSPLLPLIWSLNWAQLLFVFIHAAVPLDLDSLCCIELRHKLI